MDTVKISKFVVQVTSDVSSYLLLNANSSPFGEKLHSVLSPNGLVGASASTSNRISFSDPTSLQPTAREGEKNEREGGGSRMRGEGRRNETREEGMGGRRMNKRGKGEGE